MAVLFRCFMLIKDNNGRVFCVLPPFHIGMQTATNVTKQAAIRLPQWEQNKASGEVPSKRSFIQVSVL